MSRPGQQKQQACHGSPAVVLGLLEQRASRGWQPLHTHVGQQARRLPEQLLRHGEWYLSLLMATA